MHLGRLHHHVPSWVEEGASFHIRLRVLCGCELVENKGALAQAILEEAKETHLRQIWSCRLFLVMPDHCHAILAFPRGKKMSAIVGGWKSLVAKRHHIKWQPGYFDHRLRNRKEEDECWNYIRANPVRAGLVAVEGEWPWRFEADGPAPPG